jgi:hypothetical protein
MHEIVYDVVLFLVAGNTGEYLYRWLKKNTRFSWDICLLIAIMVAVGIGATANVLSATM